MNQHFEWKKENKDSGYDPTERAVCQPSLLRAKQSPRQQNKKNKVSQRDPPTGCIRSSASLDKLKIRWSFQWLYLGAWGIFSRQLGVGDWEIDLALDPVGFLG